MRACVYGGSATGALHKMKQVSNQDAYLYKRIKNYTVMMVADGVSLNFRGEFSKSEYASALVCSAAMNCIEKELKMRLKSMKCILKNAFQDALHQLIHFIGKKEPGDFLTTLCIAIVDASGRVHYGYVGDSGILMIDRYQRVHLLTKQKESNVVHSIFEEDHWHFDSANNVKALCVASDGILDEFSKALRCDGRIPYNLKFINYLFIAKKMSNGKDEAFSNLLDRFSISLTSDDKTAILYFHEDANLRKYRITPLSKKQIEAIYEDMNKKVFG